MEPLKQFVCDVCGEVIEKIEDGYVVWKDNKDKLPDLKIIHKKTRHITKGCDNRSLYDCSLPLSNLLGADGLAKLLSFIEYKLTLSDEKEIKKFTECFKRVQIPYYEEARQYWHKAESDGFFESTNEYTYYTEKYLKAIIRKYKNI